MIKQLNKSTVETVGRAVRILQLLSENTGEDKATS